MQPPNFFLNRCLLRRLMASKQPGIGRFTSTPQGVDMANGGSKPPQPIAPDTADDGMKPSRLVAARPTLIERGQAGVLRESRLSQWHPTQPSPANHVAGTADDGSSFETSWRRSG